MRGLCCFCLFCVMWHVFIDAKWVAEEYLKCCKAGVWKKEITVESFKCFNSERWN
jgi:hypothetical protein